MRSRSKGRYGTPGRHGRAVLEEAVHGAGYSRRRSVAVVDAVLDAWKGALARHEEIELPIGRLRVHRNPPKRRVMRSRAGIQRKMFDLYRQPFSLRLSRRQPLGFGREA